MQNAILILFLLFFSHLTFSQSEIKVKDKYGYSEEQLFSVEENLQLAITLIDLALKQMEGLLLLDEVQVINAWNSDETITSWLGHAESIRHIQKAHRRIKKLNKKSSGKILIVFNRERKNGLCHGSRHAWAIPNGKVKIHLCPQFMFKSDYLQSKILVHELGHESGILFHKKVYWKSAALRVAKSNPSLALKNPENFAFYIMTFYSKIND